MPADPLGQGLRKTAKPGPDLPVQILVGDVVGQSRLTRAQSGVVVDPLPDRGRPPIRPLWALRTVDALRPIRPLRSLVASRSLITLGAIRVLWPV
jgi:hypothetical protein